LFRYSVDVPLDKTIVNKDSLKDPKNTRKARLEIKKKFEERYVKKHIVREGKIIFIFFFFFSQAQGGKEPMVFPKTSILSTVLMYIVYIHRKC
jgi:hypothetical protein